MGTEKYQDRKMLYVVFREIDEVSAVFTDLHQVKRYVNLHETYYPGVPVDYISLQEDFRLYNLYPVGEAHLAGIHRKIQDSRPGVQDQKPSLLSSDDAPRFFPEEKFDGYLLVLENFPCTVLGAFRDLQSADIFSDEYLAVYPQHVIVFIEYRKNTVFQNIWETEDGKIKFLFNSFDVYY